MHGLVYPPNLLNSLPILDADIHSLDPETFAQLHLQHTLSHPPDNILFPFLHGLEGDNHAQNAFFATSNSAHPVQHRHHHYHSQELTSRITPKIPKYRGLVWVVCEEDLEQAGDIVSLRILRRKPVLLSCDKTGSSSSSYSESDDDDEEDFDDEDEDLEMMSMSMDLDDRSSFTADEDDVVLASPIFNSQMQVDDVAVVAPDSLDHTSTVELDLDDVMKQKQEPHMHPIHHRAPHPPTTLSLPIPLPSIIGQPLTPSSGSDDSNTSVSPVSIFDSSVGTEMESLSNLTPCECPASAQPPQPAQPQPIQSQTEVITDPYSPPLLTSTFRPKELLRRVRVEKPDGDTCSQQRKWEFVPAKVPDGISLRNFGVQVPIYATLSDIVVYSPKGASPAAIALARKFRAAMKSKRAERMRAAAAASSCNGGGEEKVAESEGLGLPRERQQGQTPLSPPASITASHENTDSDTETTVNSAAPGLHANSSAISTATLHTKPTVNGIVNGHTHPNTKPEDEDDLLKYNVFVLDATIDDLRRKVPYLMMRMCGPGVPGGSTSSMENDKIKVVAKAKADAKANNSGLTKAKTESFISISTSTPISKSLSMSYMQRDALFHAGAHIDGPDGHLVEERIFEKEERERTREKREGSGMDLDVIDDMDMDVDVDESGVAVVPTQEEEEEILLPNTVDFAMREKEEMRDLTKASEIISLFPETSILMTSPPSSPRPGFTHTPVLPHPSSPSLSSKQPGTLETKGNWDPSIGQVYLGNSGDVPLALDVPSRFRHAASLIRDATLNGNNPCAGLAEYFPTDDDEDGLDLDEAQPLPADDLFNYIPTNDPTHGFGYDIAVECHELAPFPSAAHLRAADEHIGTLDLLWKERWERGWRAREEKRIKKRRASGGGIGEEYDSRTRQCPPTPPRPPPHASAVIHLPFPSSPSNTQTTMVSLMPVIRFLEKWMKPLPVVPPPVPAGTVTPEMKDLKLIGSGDTGTVPQAPTPPSPATTTGSARRWSSVTALMPSFPSFPLGGPSSSTSTPNNLEPNPASAITPPPAACSPPPPAARNRSFTSPSPYQHLPYIPKPQQTRTRPLKILLYSSDGYTESSVPALCLLMAIKSLNLPEAYLELQVVKRRSFFVYQGDLGILKRVEARLKEDKERERGRERLNGGFLTSGVGTGSVNANGKRIASVRGGYPVGTAAQGGTTSYPTQKSSFMGRPAAKSVSFAHAPLVEPQEQNQSTAPTPIPLQANRLPGTCYVGQGTLSGSLPTQTHVPHLPTPMQTAASYSEGSGYQEGHQVVKGRPRANTSPWLPSLFGGDHQSWFNDPRFDGSFPSRVLPFLYLGNLNHASNAYMLHALGITHVVSVGECALVPPPPHHMPSGGMNEGCLRPGPNAHFIAGKGPGVHGSLWIEEREGRIKVLDIKGVCDDGIDTLEPQLEPICDWIDKARLEGGQVLVHCRVGVSRSATVTIAYVMKHLGLPLVDAYLIVRSRRLSVLIQPNMRLLYNLCGWEIKLAKERGKGDERKVKKELARTLTWPYLAKEVHALNDKYLH